MKIKTKTSLRTILNVQFPAGKIDRGTFESDIEFFAQSGKANSLRLGIEVPGACLRNDFVPANWPKPMSDFFKAVLAVPGQFDVYHFHL